MSYLDIKVTYETDDDNTIAGDLHLTDGDVVWIDGAEAVAQHIRARLKMFKGEWFLNEDEGVPWFDEIFEKGTTDARISAILRQVILGTPGVTTLTSLTLERNRAERSLAVTFEAVTDEGVNIVSSDYGEFSIII
jgi:hypothetical protein